MSSSGGGGDSNAKREKESFDSSAANTDTDASEEDGSKTRKRKATRPPTEADEAAATATLMSMPQNISKAKAKKETNVSGDASSKDNRSFESSDHDLSTIEGQQALNPSMSVDQARFQAKREYNRLNAARARIRNKEMLEDLHGKVATLSKRAEDLERENEILRAQVKVLTAQQQNQQQQQAQQQAQQAQAAAGQSQQQQAQARPLDVMNQHTASRNQQDTLAVTLLNVLQGGGGGAAAAAAQSSVQNNQLNQNAANPLAQLFPGLQGIAGVNMRSPAPSAPAPAQSNNPLDGLSQILKNLQNQQQQQQQQQALRMQQRQQHAPPTDLQSMLNLLMGNSAATPAPAAPTPTPPAFPPGLAALGQSAGLNENFLKEFLAQQQNQQQQQQQNLQQQRPQDNRSLVNALTGQVAPSNNSGGAPNPSALAEILAKADPLTRQNVLNMLQSNPSLGQSIFAQLDPSKNGGNQRQQNQPQQQTSPSMHSMTNQNDAGSLSARSQTGGDANTSNMMANKNGFTLGMNGTGEQLNPQNIPGRDQLNQLLPTLSPKTLYSILKQQQPDSQEQQQQGDQNGDGDMGSRASV
eukprot:scaffold3666_cov160-Amphora_coffeaeformis.AAC.3